MDTFYCIKLIGSNGNRGYVMDTPKGINLIVDGLIADITQFKTYQDAQQFIRDRKLERGGTKAYIRDNHDLIKEFNKDLVKMDKDVFYIEDVLGYKLCFDSAKDAYFLDKRETGFCVWEAEEQCTQFINAYELTDVFVKKIEYKNPE